MTLYSLYRVGENILSAGFPVFVFPPFLVTLPLSLKNILCTEIVLVDCLVVAFSFVYFLFVLSIHSSNEVREALEKTNEDEFGHYTSSSKFLAAWKRLRIVNKSRTFSYKYFGFRRVIWKNIGLPDV